MKNMVRQNPHDPSLRHYLDMAQHQAREELNEQNMSDRAREMVLYRNRDNDAQMSEEMIQGVYSRIPSEEERLANETRDFWMARVAARERMRQEAAQRQEAERERMRREAAQRRVMERVERERERAARWQRSRRLVQEEPRMPSETTHLCGPEHHCSICLETLKKNQPKKVFRCGHCIHQTCWDERLTEIIKCPICRAQI